MYSKAVAFHLHPQNGVSGESEYTISGLVLTSLYYTGMNHDLAATAHWGSGDVSFFVARFVCVTNDVTVVCRGWVRCLAEKVPTWIENSNERAKSSLSKLVFAPQRRLCRCSCLAGGISRTRKCSNPAAFFESLYSPKCNWRNRSVVPTLEKKIEIFHMRVLWSRSYLCISKFLLLFWYCASFSCMLELVFAFRVGLENKMWRFLFNIIKTRAHFVSTSRSLATSIPQNVPKVKIELNWKIFALLALPSTGKKLVTKKFQGWTISLP